MDRLKQALQFNNEGVSLLLASNDAEAITCLRQSLTIFQGILHLYDHSNGEYTPTHLKTNNEPSSPSTAVHGSAIALPGMPSDFFFVYSNLIKFDVDYIMSSSQGPSSYNDVHIFIATVILNVALAYHRQYFWGKQQFLLKAKAMYEMASSLLVGKQFGSSNQGAALLLGLAVTNNLSMIRHEQGDYDVSTRGFQRLAFLINTRHSCNTCTLRDALIDDMVVGMSLNVFFANSKATAAPAA